MFELYGHLKANCSQGTLEEERRKKVLSGMTRSWNLFRKNNTTEVQHRSTHIPTLDK